MDSPALVARMESFELSVGFPQQTPRMFSLLDLVVLTTPRLSMGLTPTWILVSTQIILLPSASPLVVHDLTEKCNEDAIRD